MKILPLEIYQAKKRISSYVTRTSLVRAHEEESLADCLSGGIGIENHYTLSLVQNLVDDTLLVSENEISQAIRYVFETQRMVLKNVAEVETAALLAKKLEVQKMNVALIYNGNKIAEST